MKRRGPASSIRNARSRISSFVKRGLPGTKESTNSTQSLLMEDADDGPSDVLNYALLIALYTLQGIPMGLSASIPFLLQEKMKKLASSAALNGAVSATASALGSEAGAEVAAEAVRLSYNANAIFALCSWPFSLKLLWAPIVDSVFFRQFGRRKSWLIPVQTLAGMVMVGGANFVEQQLGLTSTAIGSLNPTSLNIKGVTAFFFVLYFLMATQDIAVDGWALTMLSRKNRGRGPVCNSIGQNIGYFLSFVGFLALNDPESSEKLWRPLLRLPSNPAAGVVSLGGFIRFMGYLMLATTTVVAIFKKEDGGGVVEPKEQKPIFARISSRETDDDDENELDASEIGLKETYRRLWAVCKLPSVRWLFVVLLTYRLPTALSDNVKFLKAVEYGLSKSTTALLSPSLILPLGIIVPIVASKVWHGHPLRQFTTSYKLRVTLVPVLDLLMLTMVRRQQQGSVAQPLFWLILAASTAMQAICNSLQFNAQMVFFASRVDPTIGGSYMTLLNTAANLGGTWPTPLVMWLIGKFTHNPTCHGDSQMKQRSCEGGRDPYFALQGLLSIAGILWVVVVGPRVKYLAELPDASWRTPANASVGGSQGADKNIDLESAEVDVSRWNIKTGQKDE